MRPSRRRPGARRRRSSRSRSSADGDRHLPPGEVGEIGIRTRGQHQMLLARRPRRPRRCSRDDLYVRTGDIGYLDEDGYLFIVDRKKEIIIRGGENISAAEVEAACYACPAISPKSRCSGSPTIASAKCRSRSSIWPTARRSGHGDLRDFLDGKLAKFKIPERVIVSARAAAAPRHRQVRPPRLEGAVPRIEPRPPDFADRRRRRRRPDRRFRLVAAARCPAISRSGAGEQAFGNFIKIARKAG